MQIIEICEIRRPRVTGAQTDRKTGILVSLQNNVLRTN